MNEDKLSNADIEQLLKGIVIPPQPQIMVDLQIEQCMPDPDFGKISKLIAQDPGLSGALLKLVNSSYFGLSTKVLSIHKAVSLLGSRSVVNIINSLSVREALGNDQIISLNRFWDGAQDIAMTSLALAKHLSSENPDEMYALGLFHDCGIPLMMKRFANYFPTLETAYAEVSENRRVVDYENIHFNTNHAVVGHYISKAWQLPDDLCISIAYHHNVIPIFKHKSPCTMRVKQHLAILKMADNICKSSKILGNQKIDYEWKIVGAEILEQVGLSEYEFSQIKNDIIDFGATSYR
ncbi:HDOD domain-containing protein [Pseudomonas sp. ADAK13]|uniref:HDOD domain-containing protein n=1 Tax=Pseudomonas sp. ADAK13 TaxID=2730847 RepID=UPI001464378F|nr:HDOD domain-containing protein [Pseudomonas sp. ADAK13]QJI37111.1 HDOD domain-containing protein [Pseudomonas sp. ADAK13]